MNDKEYGKLICKIEKTLPKFKQIGIDSLNEYRKVIECWIDEKQKDQSNYKFTDFIKEYFVLFDSWNGTMQYAFANWIFDFSKNNRYAPILDELNSCSNEAELMETMINNNNLYNYALQPCKNLKFFARQQLELNVYCLIKKEFDKIDKLNQKEFDLSQV